MIKRRVHIIMPMAGDGSRFFNNGIKTPKPIIKAKGEYFMDMSFEDKPISIIERIKLKWFLLKHMIKLF